MKIARARERVCRGMFASGAEDKIFRCGMCRLSSTFLFFSTHGSRDAKRRIRERISLCSKANRVFSILNPHVLLPFFPLSPRCRYLQAFHRRKNKKDAASTKSATVYMIFRNFPALDRSSTLSSSPATARNSSGFMDFAN